MHRDDRLAAVHVAVHHPRHELVALRVEMLVGSGLAYARRELAIAQVVVGSDRKLLRPGEPCVGWIGPVDGEAPREDAVVSENAVQCVPPAASTTFGAPAGGSVRPSRSALFRKFTPSTIMHCSVAGSPSSMWRRSTAQVCF